MVCTYVLSYVYVQTPLAIFLFCITGAQEKQPVGLRRMPKRGKKPCTRGEPNQKPFRPLVGLLHAANDPDQQKDMLDMEGNPEPSFDRGR
jgi:hypothetical protein